MNIKRPANLTKKVGHVSSEKIKGLVFNFRYNSNQLLSLRISSGKTFPFVLDLLLLSDGQTYHYVLIQNLLKLVAKINGKEHRDRNHLCRNCLHICSSAELLRTHQTTCLEKDSVQITMPEPSKNKFKFENYTARWFSPFVIYLDLESLIVPISTAKNNPSISGTVTIEKHEPCSYCLIVIERENPEPVHFDIYTGPDCMTRLLTKLEKLARFFIIRKGSFQISLVQLRPKKISRAAGFAMLLLKVILKKSWTTVILQESSLDMLITSVT